MPKHTGLEASRKARRFRCCVAHMRAWVEVPLPAINGAAPAGFLAGVDTASKYLKMKHWNEIVGTNAEPALGSGATVKPVPANRHHWIGCNLEMFSASAATCATHKPALTLRR